MQVWISHVGISCTAYPKQISKKHNFQQNGIRSERNLNPQQPPCYCSCQLQAKAGCRLSFFPAFWDGETSNRVHVCMRACQDDGLATMPKSRSLKTLHTERVTLLETAQLPVSIYNDYSWCQSSLPHCFHLPADKCLYKNAAAVKGTFDSTYVSWNGFCRQPGRRPEEPEKIIPHNDNVWDHKNSNHSLDITPTLVDFSCYNRKS